MNKGLGYKAPSIQIETTFGSTVYKWYLLCSIWSLSVNFVFETRSLRNDKCCSRIGLGFRVESKGDCSWTFGILDFRVWTLGFGFCAWRHSYLPGIMRN